MQLRVALTAGILCICSREHKHFTEVKLGFEGHRYMTFAMQTRVYLSILLPWRPPDGCRKETHYSAPRTCIVLENSRSYVGLDALRLLSHLDLVIAVFDENKQRVRHSASDAMQWARNTLRANGETVTAVAWLSGEDTQMLALAPKKHC